eukprot:7173040-Prymnesium_polylepis.1
MCKRGSCIAAPLSECRSLRGAELVVASRRAATLLGAVLEAERVVATLAAPVSALSGRAEPWLHRRRPRSSQRQRIWGS